MNHNFPKGHNATWNGRSYTLHSTEIARLSGGVITLNSGGWRTFTTKDHINDLLNHLGSNYRVWSDRGQWFVYENGVKLEPFYDGITLAV